ncbi:major histocompatibility complex class I-related gene protein isoform X1 [Fundulus heteroclitus]|uniref:major histocompatibility complex class I-related gene protein isoform X1 n=1 Tax=Fundulus heteroclitus TaxID=8078 RepID=UPI00165C28A4|nr:major histocompatibility complex class I-related gene protein isoform X1 [Fundulus heteroclitus]
MFYTFLCPVIALECIRTAMFVKFIRNFVSRCYALSDLLTFHVPKEKHALGFFITGSLELSNFSKLEVSAMIDEESVGFCDGSNKRLKLNYDWIKTFLHGNPLVSEWFSQQCFGNLPNTFRGIIAVLKEELKQPQGLHILQLVISCDWDEETQKVNAAVLYGYNGEDFITLDLENLIWIALQPQAIEIKQAWNTNKARSMFFKTILTQWCPKWLKRLLDKGKRILLRTEHPSLSLLQKSPSAPVSCHATGFFPSRALMFWRKDGAEIHENVEHGEILPNNDGTFQMSIYLNISSISPEDWRRYDCVFQLHDREDMIKLDEAVIRTNKESPSSITLPITAAVISFVLISIAAAAGYVAYKKKTDRDHPLPSTSQEKNTELRETLNPET